MGFHPFVSVGDEDTHADNAEYLTTSSWEYPKLAALPCSLQV